MHSGSPGEFGITVVISCDCQYGRCTEFVLLYLFLTITYFKLLGNCHYHEENLLSINMLKVDNEFLQLPRLNKADYTVNFSRGGLCSYTLYIILNPLYPFAC